MTPIVHSPPSSGISGVTPKAGMVQKWLDFCLWGSQAPGSFTQDVLFYFY